MKIQDLEELMEGEEKEMYMYHHLIIRGILTEIMPMK